MKRFPPNKATPVNAPTASRFQVQCPYRRVPEQRRWTTRYTMRTFLLLVFWAASAFGVDTSDIRLVTTSRTNESGAISIKEVFTRNGETNLVRNTRTKSGMVQMRIHRLYHGGALVGMLTAMPDSSSTMSEPASPYAVDFEYGPSNQMKYAAIVGKDGIVVDIFTCTNGVLTPVASSALQEAAHAGQGAKSLMTNALNGTYEQFKEGFQRIVKPKNK